MELWVQGKARWLEYQRREICTESELQKFLKNVSWVLQSTDQSPQDRKLPRLGKSLPKGSRKQYRDLTHYLILLRKTMFIEWSQNKWINECIKEWFHFLSILYWDKDNSIRTYEKFWLFLTLDLSSPKSHIKREFERDRWKVVNVGMVG